MKQENTSISIKQYFIISSKCLTNKTKNSAESQLSDFFHLSE